MRKPLVVTSPLERAHDTAMAASKSLGVHPHEIVHDSRFEPQHMGEAEGTQTSKDFHPTLDHHYRNDPDTDLPGMSGSGVPGESANKFVRRALSGIRDVMTHVGTGTINFIRHGETDYNSPDTSQEVIRGSTNIPLNEQGKKDAQQIASIIKNHPADAHVFTHYRVRHLLRAWIQKGAPDGNDVKAIDLDRFLDRDDTDHPGTIMRVHVKDGKPVA